MDWVISYWNENGQRIVSPDALAEIKDLYTQICTQTPYQPSDKNDLTIWDGNRHVSYVLRFQTNESFQRDGLPVNCLYDESDPYK